MSKGLPDHGWDSWEKAAEEGPRSITWKSFKAFLVVLVIVGVTIFLVGMLGRAAGVVENTFDSDNVLYNYEWFKQQYESVRALDSKIGIAKATWEEYKKSLGERKEWDREDKIEDARLFAVYRGLMAQREDVVAQYNARSKMANRVIFKGRELPVELE